MVQDLLSQFMMGIPTTMVEVVEVVRYKVRLIPLALQPRARRCDGVDFQGVKFHRVVAGWLA